MTPEQIGELKTAAWTSYSAITFVTSDPMGWRAFKSWAALVVPGTAWGEQDRRKMAEDGQLMLRLAEAIDRHQG
jgi:hypothetical protein